MCLLKLFSDDKHETDPAKDLTLFDILFNDEKEIVNKTDYDENDFDDECEDEDDYYFDDDK